MSYSRYRSRSRSVDSSDVENPGNNLFVTGLSSRLTDRDLEKHFSTEGEVIDASIVLDPWTRESRGFGFVTMANLKEAERCIKYLDSSVLEGRVITVEKQQVDARSCMASNSKDTQPKIETMLPQPKGCKEKTRSNPNTGKVPWQQIIASKEVFPKQVTC
ncbi:Scaffold attachment factor B2 [Hordeum vulgare]|nr:Scaffold attachment factor B2 [Hordeum vulgare]